MRTLVNSRELSRHVVRIDHADGAPTLGTGFYVAPGWVLTAAHVVYDAYTQTELAAVRTIPYPFSGGGLMAEVVARSARQEDSVLGPFPDLALLRIDNRDHPCVWLDYSIGADECYAWGFPEREPDHRPGSPARFTVEGTEGDDFLRLTAGQATPGLSGAPLVSPQLRGVVGVIIATRDSHSRLGGWAAPVAALVGGGGLSDDFARLGREVWEAGRAAVLSNRSTWHAVLPVDGANSTVLQTWFEGSFDYSLPPSTMLQAESAVVDYMFRNDQLGQARDWCEREERLLVAYVDGFGGTGKTRFAIELCKDRRENGWVAGFMLKDDRRVVDVATPRLLVVDYVEEHVAEDLAEDLLILNQSASPLSPVRVLLLSRPAAGAESKQALDALREAATGEALSALYGADRPSGVVADLSITQREELFSEALTAFGQTWFTARGLQWSAPDKTPDLSGKQHSRALDVLFEAFDAALSGPRWEHGDRPPVERVLIHERKHWRGRLRSKPRDGFPDVDDSLLDICVAFSTLVGARDGAEARALLKLVPGLARRKVRRSINRWLRRLYEGPDLYNPLRPDRLGEALITEVLSRQDDNGVDLITKVLRMRSDAQVERALDVLVRLAPYEDEDPYSVPPNVAQRIAYAATVALSSCYPELVERCIKQAYGLGRHPGHTLLLDGLSRVYVAMLTPSRVAALPVGLQNQLSKEGNALGELAREHGRTAEASIIFSRVLDVAHRQVNREPANPIYRADLSTSYTCLADIAKEAGRPGEAEDCYRRALHLSQELARLEPGNAVFQHDVSVLLKRLVEMLQDRGRTHEAEVFCREGLLIDERLVEAESDNAIYQHGLFVSCLQVADIAYETGRSDEAEDLYNRSLRIAQDLAKNEPTNLIYKHALSLSQSRLADIARDQGRHPEAAALYQQSLDVRHGLVSLEPGNAVYRRNLSIVYSKLADLAFSLGHKDGAEAFTEQSMHIAQELTNLDPANATYRRSIATKYNKMADLARGEGRHQDAHSSYGKAIEIREDLVQLDPVNTAFRRDLSVSLERLGDLQLAKGRYDEARMLYHRSLQISRELAKLEPRNISYRRDLANSYERLGLVEAHGGSAREAERRFMSVVHMRRELHEQVPQRVDLVEELCGTLRELAETTNAAGVQWEVSELLTPFEAAGALTRRGKALLIWARHGLSLS